MKMKIQKVKRKKEKCALWGRTARFCDSGSFHSRPTSILPLHVGGISSLCTKHYYSMSIFSFFILFFLFVHCNNSAGIWNSYVPFKSCSSGVLSSLFSLVSFLGRLVLISIVTCIPTSQYKFLCGEERSQEGKMYRRIFAAVVYTHRPIIF